jgi:TP901 family phage tail tape measure protein
MEWEAGMAQISKTTGIKKGTEDFEKLNQELKDLYAQSPTTVAGIQSVAAAAGSLGIEKTALAGFTQVALEMGSAFDIPAEEAAVAIGKIKGQLKSLPEDAADSADFARKFGSAVDYVGNNFNATERDVLDFSTRVSGSLSSLGAGAYEIAGWGGMLASVFPSAERAAGSFDALLNQLTANEDSAAVAARLLGVNVEEFMASMTTDPTDTILRIGAALEDLPSDKLMSTAKALGGAYGMDVLVKMIGHTQEWKQAIEDTVEAGKKGESIGESFASGADNARAQLKILRNSVGAILQDIGGPILDAFTPVISGLAAGLNKIRTIGENLWEPLLTVTGPVRDAVSEVVDRFGDLANISLDTLVAGAKGVNEAFRIGGAFVGAFKKELRDVVTSSSLFKTAEGYVNSFKEKLSGIGTTFSEAKNRIVDGLSNAIPTAISGAISAFGRLGDKAASALGIGDLIDKAESSIGQVTGFFSRVYDTAAEELGWKTENAMKDGLVDGANSAQASVASTVESAVSQGATAGFDAIKKGLVDAGYDPTLAGYMTAFGLSPEEAVAVINKQTSSKHEYGGIFGRGSGEYVTTIDGTSVGLRYQSSKHYGQDQASLWVGGQRVAGPITGSDARAVIKALLDEINVASLANEATYLDLMGKSGQAEVWRLQQRQAEETGKKLSQPVLDTGMKFKRYGEDTSVRLNTAGINTSREIVSAGYKIGLDGRLAASSILTGGQIGGKATEEGGLVAGSALTSAANAIRSAIPSIYALGRVGYSSGETGNALTSAANSIRSAIPSIYALGRVGYSSGTGVGSTTATTSGSKSSAIIETRSATDIYKSLLNVSDLSAWGGSPKYYTKVADVTSATADELDYLGDAANTCGIAAYDLSQAQTRAVSATDFYADTTFQASRGIQYTQETLDYMSGCVLSDFARWQESMPGLFKESYIGPTAARGYQLPAVFRDAAANTEEMSGTTLATTGSLGTYNGALKLGRNAITNFISAQNTAANSANAYATATAYASTQVYAASNGVRYTAEAMTDMAGCVLSDFARWQESTPGLFYESYIGPTSGWAGPGKGAISSPSNYQLPPIFQSFANEGYIASPTLAIVGDRPGGEYVVGAARFEAALEKMRGGTNITINSPITVYGGGDTASLDAVLAKRNRELMQEITSKISAAAKHL